jgi:hypothetical protein
VLSYFCSFFLVSFNPDQTRAEGGASNHMYIEYEAMGHEREEGVCVAVAWWSPCRGGAIRRAAAPCGSLAERKALVKLGGLGVRTIHSVKCTRETASCATVSVKTLTSPSQCIHHVQDLQCHATRYLARRRPFLCSPAKSDSTPPGGVCGNLFWRSVFRLLLQRLCFFRFIF